MASFPTSVKTYTSKVDGVDTVAAADVNSLQDEMTAVQTDILNGMAHDQLPDANATRSFGSTAKRWLKGWFSTLDVSGVATFNALAYTWPASQSANTFLKTDGAGTLSWAVPTPTNDVCDGRLTLTSATPVTTADVTGATTIYFTPYRGQYIALYDGAGTWAVISFAETSLALGTLTSGLPYDVFAYNNSGTLALELLAWTSSTARATALVLQNGVYVKSGATTRRYLGTFYTTSTTTTEDSYAKRFVWNYYNRVPRPMRRLETTASWNYSTATWQQANASTANQLDLVIGVAEVPVHIEVQAFFSNNAGAVRGFASIGANSTTTPATGVIGNWPATAAAAGAITAISGVRLDTFPAIGRTFYAWLEQSEATPTTTFYGSGTGTPGIAAGLTGSVLG